MQLDLGRYELIEPFADGRLLVIPAEGPQAGTLVVVGESNREPEAARMGYLPRSRPPARRTAPAPARGAAGRPAARPAVRHEAPVAARRDPRTRFLPLAERRALDLLESLLNHIQTVQWRRWGAFWVDTPRGPVRLGRLHDLRFRPTSHPAEEWSLCVVPTGRPLPIGDVWSNLLLALSVQPEHFFRTANVRARALPLSPPHPCQV